MSRYAQVAYTDRVREVQREQGSARAAERQLAIGSDRDPLNVQEAAFITGRDGFYLASVSETGWPYVQFRGGPPGFLRLIDDKTLAFADLRGNRQYISLGNLA